MPRPSNSVGYLQIDNTQSEIIPHKMTDGTNTAAIPALDGDCLIALIVPEVTGVAAASVALDPYKYYDFGVLNMSMTLTLNAPQALTGYCKEYHFKFTAASGAAITLPNGALYAGGSAPTLVTGHTYEYSIVNNLVAVGEFF